MVSKETWDVHGVGSILFYYLPGVIPLVYLTPVGVDHSIYPVIIIEQSSIEHQHAQSYKP